MPAPAPLWLTGSNWTSRWALTTGKSLRACCLQWLAEVPAVALRVIHCVAVRPARPDKDLGHVGACSLRALPMRREIRHSDALKLGYLAKLGRALEARPRATQHDHPAVVEKQFTVL